MLFVEVISRQIFHRKHLTFVLVCKDFRRNAKSILYELRGKYAPSNVSKEGASKTTLGMILDGSTVAFVIPGSPAFRPSTGVNVFDQEVNQSQLVKIRLMIKFCNHVQESQYAKTTNLFQLIVKSSRGKMWLNYYEAPTKLGNDVLLI